MNGPNAVQYIWHVTACPVSCTRNCQTVRRLHASACRAAWAHPQSCVCCRRSRLCRPALCLDLRTSLCNMLPCPGRHGPTWWPPPRCSWVCGRARRFASNARQVLPARYDVLISLRFGCTTPGVGRHWHPPHHAPMECVMVHAMKGCKSRTASERHDHPLPNVTSTIVYQHGKQPTDDREVHGRL
jgi:hypothetical protein